MRRLARLRRHAPPTDGWRGDVGWKIRAPGRAVAALGGVAGTAAAAPVNATAPVNGLATQDSGAALPVIGNLTITDATDGLAT